MKDQFVLQEDTEDESPRRPLKVLCYKTETYQYLKDGKLTLQVCYLPPPSYTHPCFRL